MSPFPDDASLAAVDALMLSRLRASWCDALDDDGASSLCGASSSSSGRSSCSSAASSSSSSTSVAGFDGAGAGEPIAFTCADLSDPDVALVAVSEGFSRLTGYCDDEVVGRSCRFLQGPETDPESIDEIRRAVSDCFSVEVRGLVNYRKNGSAFKHDLLLTPLRRASDGVALFVVGISNAPDDVRAARLGADGRGCQRGVTVAAAAAARAAEKPLVMPPTFAVDTAAAFSAATIAASNASNAFSKDLLSANATAARVLSWQRHQREQRGAPVDDDDDEAASSAGSPRGSSDDGGSISGASSASGSKRSDPMSDGDDDDDDATLAAARGGVRRTRARPNAAPSAAPRPRRTVALPPRGRRHRRTSDGVATAVSGAAEQPAVVLLNEHLEEATTSLRRGGWTRLVG